MSRDKNPFECAHDLAEYGRWGAGGDVGSWEQLEFGRTCVEAARHLMSMAGCEERVAEYNGYIKELDSLISKLKPVRKFAVDVLWPVARSFEVEAESIEDAEKIIKDRINAGDINVWMDKFEATDDVEVRCSGEETPHGIEYF